MAHILTVTMNPAIDIWTSVAKVEPTRKLRCGPARLDPGGGGINVARVARRLGAEATALFPSGGATGQLLERLVSEEGLKSVVVPIKEETREDFTARETSTGEEFRFVLPGPFLSEAEWRRCLEAFATFQEPVDFVVASGSLPPGVPDDFYARLAEIARDRKTPFAVDGSGPPLEAALARGVDVVKPSLQELRDLTAKELLDDASRVGACEDLIQSGQARAVALTLGGQGAMLVTAEGAWRADPLPVTVIGAVGAGDSFLGAMLFSMACGDTMEESFHHAVAAASAALLAPGTQLCNPEQLRDLYEHVVVERLRRGPQIRRGSASLQLSAALSAPDRG